MSMNWWALILTILLIAKLVKSAVRVVDHDDVVWPRRGLIIRKFGKERDIELCWHWVIPFSLPRYFDADYGSSVIYARPRHWICARRYDWDGKWTVAQGSEAYGGTEIFHGPPYRQAKQMNKQLDRNRDRYMGGELEAAAWALFAVLLSAAYVGVLVWAATRVPAL